MLRGLLALAIALLVLASPAAHDLERTTVHLQIAADDSFTLRLAHDPSWLLLRMETFAGVSGVATSDAAARDARLRELAPQMIDRVVLWIDGREVRPASAEYTPPPASVPPGEFALASYTLRGTLPASARALRWYYGLVADKYPFTVERSDSSSYTEWVLGDAWSTTIQLDRPFARPSRLTRLREYIVLGYTHVVPIGLDHIAFVIGLFLLARGRQLLTQALTFIVAHLTGLGAAAAGLVAPPSPVVAALSAVFILYVAIENLRARTRIAVRVALVFAFGVLHAMRFAGTLSSLPLSRGDFAVAMVGFNTGVEAGQISAVAIAALLVGRWRGRLWYHTRVVVPTSLLIAGSGIYLMLRGIRL